MFIDLFMERMNIMAAIAASKSSSGGGSIPEPDPEEPVDPSVLEPVWGDLPKLYLYNCKFDSTLIKDSYFTGTFDYISATKTAEGLSCTYKMQGSSSTGYSKKNWNVKLDNETLNIRGWGAQKKFCLKANFIDHSHARNVCCANIWSEVCESRPDGHKIPELVQGSPNNGAIDGYPVMVYMATGEGTTKTDCTYKGIYTMNIPKDAWTFNMDKKNTNHFVVCAEENNNQNLSKVYSSEFRKEALLDGTDWELEVGNYDVASRVLNNLITFVRTATEEEFRNNLDTYLDVYSAIDYFLCSWAFSSIDSIGKNVMLYSVDGVKMYMNMYDLDSTFGLYITGRSIQDSSRLCPRHYQDNNSLLFWRLARSFKTEIIERWTQLRGSVLSVENITKHFTDFTGLISEELYAQDLTIYTDIPNPSDKSGNKSVAQIIAFIEPRLTFCDTKIPELLNAPGFSVGTGNVTLSKNLDKFIMLIGLNNVNCYNENCTVTSSNESVIKPKRGINLYGKGTCFWELEVGEIGKADVKIISEDDTTKTRTFTYTVNETQQVFDLTADGMWQYGRYNRSTGVKDETTRDWFTVTGLINLNDNSSNPNYFAYTDLYDDRQLDFIEVVGFNDSDARVSGSIWNTSSRKQISASATKIAINIANTDGLTLEEFKERITTGGKTLALYRIS